jgi:hypothetical protein
MNDLFDLLGREPLLQPVQSFLEGMKQTDVYMLRMQSRRGEYRGTSSA